MLLRFESNGPYRHRRVTPSSSKPARDPAARAALRSSLRQSRRALPRSERVHAARAVRRAVSRLFWLRSGTRIAAYVAADGELDPAPLVATALARGCHVYLPRIAHFRRARLRLLRAGGVQLENRFGIAEPNSSDARAASGFDLILVPLVAFDARGARLGMGGGYYDRVLAFRQRRRSWKRPRIVGLAYSFQELDHIEERAHDVRLDAVVTERGVTFFKERAE